MSIAGGAESSVEIAAGYRTSVLDSGEGRVVVLLHGTPFDLRAWLPVVRALGGRVRTVCFDARGHGSAVDVPVPGYGRLGGDVVALLDRLDVPDVHLVGHSWGGQTAQRVALDHPGRVNRLSLICTRASPFPPFATVAHGLRDGTADVEASLSRWFTPEELAEPGGVAATVRSWLRSADPARWADALQMISSFDVLSQLSGIAVPTDVVAAENDGVAVPQHMAEIAEAVPTASFRVLEGARHLVPIQRPEEIAGILLDQH
ncbi:alpha/beta fold hydrolase [Actinomycetospora sp. CA-101289]|uniref:alpha/beta fold hydrolase n=1 Tax=Actinomycetospora sp. CA-101289 TaxID=3239893 RepID=UPI003D99184D